MPKNDKGSSTSEETARVINVRPPSLSGAVRHASISRQRFNKHRSRGTSCRPISWTATHHAVDRGTPTPQVNVQTSRVQSRSIPGASVHREHSLGHRTGLPAPLGLPCAFRLLDLDCRVAVCAHFTSRAKGVWSRRFPYDAWAGNTCHCQLRSSLSSTSQHGTRGTWFESTDGAHCFTVWLIVTYSLSRINPYIYIYMSV